MIRLKKPSYLKQSVSNKFSSELRQSNLNNKRKISLVRKPYNTTKRRFLPSKNKDRLISSNVTLNISQNIRTFTESIENRSQSNSVSSDKTIYENTESTTSSEHLDKTLQFENIPINVSHLPKNAQLCVYDLFNSHKTTYEDNYSPIPRRTQHDIKNRALKLLERTDSEEDISAFLEDVEKELNTAMQTPRQHRFFLHAIILNSKSTKLAKTIFESMDGFQLNTTKEEVDTILFRMCFIDKSTQKIINFLQDLPSSLKDDQSYLFLFASPLLDNSEGILHLSQISQMITSSPGHLKPSVKVVATIEAIEEALIAPKQSKLYQQEIDNMLAEYTFCLTWRFNRQEPDNASFCEFFDRLPSKAFENYPQNVNIVFKTLTNLGEFDRSYRFACKFLTSNNNNNNNKNNDNSNHHNSDEKPRFQMGTYRNQSFLRLALGRNDMNIFEQLYQHVKENPKNDLMTLKGINYFFSSTSFNPETVLQHYLDLAEATSHPHSVRKQIYNAYIQCLAARESKDLIPIVKNIKSSKKAALNRQTFLWLLRALPKYKDGCQLFDDLRYFRIRSSDLFTQGKQTAFSFQALITFIENYFWKRNVIKWVIRSIVKKTNRVPVSFYRSAMDMMLTVSDPDLLSWGTSVKVVDLSSSDRKQMKYEYFLQAALKPEYEWVKRNISKWFKEDVDQPSGEHLRYWIPIQLHLRDPKTIQKMFLDYELSPDVCFAFCLLSAIKPSFPIPSQVKDYMMEKVSDKKIWFDLVTHQLVKDNDNNNDNNEDVKQKLAKLFNIKFGVNRDNFLKDDRRDHLVMFLYEVSTWKANKDTSLREKLASEIYDALSSDQWYLFNHQVLSAAFFAFKDIPSARKLFAKLSEDRDADLELALPQKELKVNIS